LRHVIHLSLSINTDWSCACIRSSNSSSKFMHAI
jgi:hypothetical protein